MTGKNPPRELKRYRLAAWVLLTSSVTLLLCLALRPQTGQPDNNLVPLTGTARVTRAVLAAPHPAQHPAFRYFLIQVGGNVLAFLPIGACLALLLYRGKVARTLFRALLVSALLSLSIEVIQLALPTRATDIDDLILNTFGALIGALIAMAWLYRRWPPARA